MRRLDVGQSDRRLGREDAWQGRQMVEKKRFVRRNILRDDPQQEIDVTCDGVTVHDLGELLNGTRKGDQRVTPAIRQLYSHEGHQAKAQFLRVESRVAAQDDAGVLKACNSSPS